MLIKTVDTGPLPLSILDSITIPLACPENDAFYTDVTFLQPNEIVSASATFGILIGIGSICGPLLVSSFMEILGAVGFYIYLFLIHGLLGLFGLYRMTQRTKPRDLESQYNPLPRNISPAGMEMNPVTEPVDDEK